MVVYLAVENRVERNRETLNCIDSHFRAVQ